MTNKKIHLTANDPESIKINNNLRITKKARELITEETFLKLKNDKSAGGLVMTPKEFKNWLDKL
ncbi:MAG: hypothetical protein LBT62_07275 [Deltaproteobacteria bacterium]|jgi:hypothetical protein|nr:hypothetical protein [Deltaproteobacteria bacterium]